MGKSIRSDQTKGLPSVTKKEGQWGVPGDENIEHRVGMQNGVGGQIRGGGGQGTSRKVEE